MNYYSEEQVIQLLELQRGMQPYSIPKLPDPLIIQRQGQLFLSTGISVPTKWRESDISTRKLLGTKMTDMDITVRALNILRQNEMTILADILSYEESELLQFRNFGKKSLSELKAIINSKGINFGIDVNRYGFTKHKRKSYA